MGYLTPQVEVKTREESKVGVYGADTISYDKAFELIGGDAALKRNKQLTRDLQAESTDDSLEEELCKLLPRDYTKCTGYSTKLFINHT